MLEYLRLSVTLRMWASVQHPSQLDYIKLRILCLLHFVNQVRHEEHRHSHGRDSEAGHSLFLVGQRVYEVPVGRAGSQIHYVDGVLRLRVEGLEGLPVGIRVAHAEDFVEIAEQKPRAQQKYCYDEDDLSLCILFLRRLDGGFFIVHTECIITKKSRSLKVKSDSYYASPNMNFSLKWVFIC